ncbi:MAG: hypothetical protein A2Y14_04170 [Verrucomicrobia bacterium GWF2_51_19]|nr:MAG: hypothetical protein A2Y14_04170 [Verrucomicrobia bacterium GWF2_51_19]HCJ11805.1 hypothetical protein [Opitutae bacterium]
MFTAESVFLTQEAREGLCSFELAEQYTVFPVETCDDGLRVQVAAGTSPQTLSLLSQILEMPIIPFFTAAETILKNIHKHYQHLSVAESANERYSIRAYIDFILEDALSQRASDIHIECFLDKIRLRYRIDGLLYERESPPKHLQSALLGRLKILSLGNPAIQRQPQEGSFYFPRNGEKHHVRASFVPSLYGEHVVLRFLSAKDRLTLDQLGMSPELQMEVQALLSQRGLLILAGPTNSGKTTTAYALLSILKKDKKVLTLENPIEYAMDGIQQIDIQANGRLHFREALKASLRQNPDVLFLGEIRDKQTAEAAYSAALTGHLVLSTLHCENADKALFRLRQLGLDDTVKQCLLGVLFQTLTPIPCPDRIPPTCGQRACFQGPVKSM